MRTVFAALLGAGLLSLVFFGSGGLRADHNPITHPMPVNWICGAGGKVCSPDYPAHALLVDVISNHSGGGVPGRNASVFPANVWMELDLTNIGIPANAATVCVGWRGELNNGQASSKAPILKIELKRSLATPDDPNDDHQLVYKDRIDRKGNQDSTRKHGAACLAADGGKIAFRWTKQNWLSGQVFGYVGLWVTQYTLP